MSDPAPTPRFTPEDYRKSAAHCRRIAAIYPRWAITAVMHAQAAATLDELAAVKEQLLDSDRINLVFCPKHADMETAAHATADPRCQPCLLDDRPPGATSAALVHGVHLSAVLALLRVPRSPEHSRLP